MILPKQHLLVCCLLALVLAAVLANGAPSSAGGDLHQAAQSARATFEPAKLFDFENYKRLFKKTYSGFLEELARKKYFLSRAFRAFVSAIKYKYRRASYYLAINGLSDASPKELDRMRNRVIERSVPRSQSMGRSSVVVEVPEGEKLDVPELLPGDGQELELELKQFASAHLGQPARVSGPSPRELPLEKLLDTGNDAQLSEGAARKIKVRAASNNEQFTGPSELVCAKADERERVFFGLVRLRPNVPKSVLGLPDLGPRKPDKVYVDLRDTECFFLPRDQGLCGACYAFAMITLVEWLHCMKTGDLVAFSEQYMIDCGRQYIQYLDGCDGGDIYTVADFVRNFGLETRVNYPFLMRDDSCPYGPDTALANTGHTRFEFDDAISIHIDALPVVLQNGPVLLTISTAAGFQEYGGGVHGFGCDQEHPSHAVVLIGHGREDGLEYWLIRNSYSVGWGEAGHYKLAKKANCIHPEYGTQYATQDAVNLTPKIERNKRNDASIVRRHYEKNMLK